MRKRQSRTNRSGRKSGKQADQIIAALKKQRNSEKFIKLFDRGDISDYNNDDSAADCALVSLIAFRTGDDPELIFEIIQQSALMRDKWNREDYRERTIRAGVDACQGVFHFSLRPKPDFVAYIPERDEEVILCPRLARHIRESLDYIFVRNNGRQGVLRYVYELSLIHI